MAISPFIKEFEKVLERKEKKSVVTTIRMTPTDAKILKEKKLSPTNLFDVSLGKLKEIIKAENCQAMKLTKTPSVKELQGGIK
jgi:hypothetical protein